MNFKRLGISAYLFITTFLACMLSQPALSQPQRLDHPGPIPSGDAYGTSVDISGDYAIVGTGWDGQPGQRSYAAHVFQRNGTQWSHAETLTVEGNGNNSFGQRVAIDGNYILVSAKGDTVGNNFLGGGVYVFRKDTPSWTLDGRLTPSEVDADARFADDLAISGEYAIVGAGHDDTRDFNTGSAFIFERQDSTWVEAAKLVPNDGEYFDRFGAAVDIDGEYAVVGAPFRSKNGDPLGAAYIYKRDQDGQWKFMQKIVASDSTESLVFGAKVSIHGENLLVGAHYTAYVFQREDSSWTETTKIDTLDPEPRSFGESLAIQGPHIVLGNSFLVNPDTGTSTGVIYLYQKEADQWILSKTLTANSGTSRGSLGGSLALDGDQVIVPGAAETDGSFTPTAYVIDLLEEVSIDNERPAIPSEFSFDAYPNPFTQNVTIFFELPEPASVSVILYDALGRQVQVIHEGAHPTGAHTITWNANTHKAPGIYFIQLRVNEESYVQPLTQR